MRPVHKKVLVCLRADKGKSVLTTTCFLLLVLMVPRKAEGSRPISIAEDNHPREEEQLFRGLSELVASTTAKRTHYNDQEAGRRFVTVADSIEMTRVAGPADVRDHYEGNVTSKFAVFSPDRTRFVVVVRKGNLRQNSIEYSLLLFSSASVFQSPLPTILARFPSFSDRDGISDVKWLADNDTILFLGEHPTDGTQIYSVSCKSGKIEQLTREPQSIIDYSSSADGSVLVFGSQIPKTSLYDQRALDGGIVVTTESLDSLVSGTASSDCQQLFALKNGARHGESIIPEIAVCQDDLDLFVSPNGRYLLTKINVTDAPSLWRKYDDPYLRSLLALPLSPGARTLFDRYELVDLSTGIGTPLLDSPVGFTAADALWAADSKSVILTDMFLPLDLPDSEFGQRAPQSATVEVEIPSRSINIIGDYRQTMPSWDASGRYLELMSPTQPNGKEDDVQYFEKVGSRWQRVGSNLGSAINRVPEIVVEQSLNDPPRIAAIDPISRREVTLLDLNPQFNQLAFAKVEDIAWTGGAREKLHGGLYLPPDYSPGRRYPLVIQTHGFDPHAFWIDGSFTTAFAAQALAAKGIVVLQIPDDHQFLSTSEEAPRMMKTYEKAIDYLDSKGIIDRSRVGIIGFSRTCLYVKYMLTHSKYRLAAATVADGVDSGYFQYLLYATQGRGPILTSDTDKLIGSPPFGKGLSAWLKRSPGFLLDKVQTPLRIEAHGGPDGGGVLGEWEWFAGLRRLRKPVELIYLPHGTHVLDLPRERLASQQGDVDWFCFWLKGEQDPASAKSRQYSRWLGLKDPAASFLGTGATNK